MKAKVVILMVVILIVTIFTLIINKNESDYLLGFPAAEYVGIPDYKSITVSEDFVKISDGEMKTVIEADLDSRGIYKEITDRDIIEIGDIVLCDIVCDDSEYAYTDYYLFTDTEDLFVGVSDKLANKKKGESVVSVMNISDTSTVDCIINIKGIYTFAQFDDEELVLNMYSCNRMEEVYSYVREKTKRTIILNFVLDQIFENSYIKKIPKQAEIYVSNKEDIKNQYKSEQDFEDYIGMTVEEYREYNYNIYFEYMIYSVIAERENLIFTQEDFDETVRLIADMENMTEEDVLQIFDKEYIIFETICDEVENALVEYVKVEK